MVFKERLPNALPLTFVDDYSPIIARQLQIHVMCDDRQRKHEYKLKNNSWSPEGHTQENCHTPESAVKIITTPRTKPTLVTTMDLSMIETQPDSSTAQTTTTSTSYDLLASTAGTTTVPISFNLTVPTAKITNASISYHLTTATAETTSAFISYDLTASIDETTNATLSYNITTPTKPPPQNTKHTLLFILLTLLFLVICLIIVALLICYYFYRRRHRLHRPKPQIILEDASALLDSTFSETFSRTITDASSTVTSSNISSTVASTQQTPLKALFRTSLTFKDLYNDTNF